MDLGDILAKDELFLAVGRRRWFGPRRLRVELPAYPTVLAPVRDRVPLFHRIIGRLLLRAFRTVPADLHLVPAGGGASLTVRRRMFPMWPRAIEIVDANDRVVATATTAPWSPARSLLLRGLDGKAAGRVSGSLFSRTYRINDLGGGELGSIRGEDMGWFSRVRPGWRVTRAKDAGHGTMLLLLAAAFAVHLMWYDR